MADVHTPDVRSKNMAAIRNRDTKPEVFVRKALFAQGFRYRKNVKTLPGKPDIVLPKYKAVILIHGCFWHGHSCYLFKVPKTRTDFWLNKIEENRTRDLRNTRELEAQGWRVLVIWECALKGKHKLSEHELLKKTENWIRFQGEKAEIAGRFPN